MVLMGWFGQYLILEVSARSQKQATVCRLLGCGQSPSGAREPEEMGAGRERERWKQREREKEREREIEGNTLLRPRQTVSTTRCTLVG